MRKIKIRDEPIRSDPVRYKKIIRYKKPIRSGTKKKSGPKKTIRSGPFLKIFQFFWSLLGPWGPFHQIGLIERIRMVWISSSGMPWGPSYDQKRVLMILLISPFWGLGVLTVRRALKNHHDRFKNQLLRFHFDPQNKWKNSWCYISAVTSDLSVATMCDCKNELPTIK